MKIPQLLIVTFVFILSACKNQINTSYVACNLEANYDVEYLGTAFGNGNISFSPSSQNSGDIAYQITVAAPGSNTPDIAIKGMAQCLSGVVTGTFGGGVTSKPQLNVLGGKFEGLFVNSNIDRPFGRWQVSLYDSEKEKDYKLSGYWQQAASTSITKHDSVASNRLGD